MSTPTVYIKSPPILNRIYQRPAPTGQSVSYADGDDYWKVINNIDTYIAPTTGIPMLTDPVKLWKLTTFNIFNNKFRWTGLTGGCYDPDTESYYDVTGATTTKALAFPDAYIIDHHTGLGWINNYLTQKNWTTVGDNIFTQMDTYSGAGFDDYFVANKNEHTTIVNVGVHWPLYDSPPFDNIWSSSKWTSTTVEYDTSLGYNISITGGNGLTPKTNAAATIPMRYHFTSSTDPVISDPPRIYLRPDPTGEIYDPLDPTNYPVGCDGWRVFTGQDKSTQPTYGIPMFIRKDKKWLLANIDNTLGNRFVITGLTGGYFDPETGNYHDFDGTVSDRASAFPSDYFINHSTGLGGRITDTGFNVTWQTALDEIAALSFAGFDDYFLPNYNELESLINRGYDIPFGVSGAGFPTTLPPFDRTSLGAKWSSTAYNYNKERVNTMQAYGVGTTTAKTAITRYIPMRYHFNNIH
jgi:hypothetical protein